MHVVEHGRIDLAHLLDVRGFNLNADLGPGIGLRPLRAVAARTAAIASAPWYCAATRRSISKG